MLHADRLLPCAELERVERTSRWVAQLFHHMRVDHCRLDVGVTQVLLDLPNVHSAEQEMRCERVPAMPHPA